MIQTIDLSKKFKAFTAVDRVSLEVKAGHVLALLGPNGAGKTTTLRMLTSVLRPTSGRARVAGFDVVAQAAQVRSSVGILTEQHGLYGRMNAVEYLEFFGQVYRMSANTRQRRSDELLEQFGLAEARKQKIGEYSKGMRQKLALARALIHDPPVLLMDEPTSAMDPESARLVRDAIHGMSSANRTIIICTHNLAEAEELADQIAIIQHGRIITLGTVPELKSQLLGAVQFQVTVAVDISNRTIALPGEVKITRQAGEQLQYETKNPVHDNPQVVQALVEQGIPVVSLAEIPRSLEKVYLQAVGADDRRQDDPGAVSSISAKEEVTHVG